MMKRSLKLDENGIEVYVIGAIFPQLVDEAEQFVKRICENYNFPYIHSSVANDEYKSEQAKMLLRHCLYSLQEYS